MFNKTKHHHRGNNRRHIILHNEDIRGYLHISKYNYGIPLL